MEFRPGGSSPKQYQQFPSLSVLWLGRVVSLWCVIRNTRSYWLWLCKYLGICSTSLILELNPPWDHNYLVIPWICKVLFSLQISSTHIISFSPCRHVAFTGQCSIMETIFLGLCQSIGPNSKSRILNHSCLLCFLNLSKQQLPLSEM